MPPRHAYWTIILEGKPTAFRAHTQDELLPTLKQLQSRHPDVAMKWFSRGRLWTSPEEEESALAEQRRQPERRGPGWRPGGSHEDPKNRFKVPRDEKRRRFAERLRREPHPEGGTRDTSEPRERKPGGQRPWQPKPLHPGA